MKKFLAKLGIGKQEEPKKTAEKGQDKPSKESTPKTKETKDSKKTKERKPIRDWRRAYGRNNVYYIPSPISPKDKPILTITYIPTIDGKDTWTLEILGFRRIQADGYLTDVERIQMLAEDRLEQLLLKLSML